MAVEDEASPPTNSNAPISNAPISSLPERVRVTAIPPDLPIDDLETPTLFARCVGKSFDVIGRNGELFELAVGEVLGVSPAMIRFGLSRNTHAQVKDSWSCPQHQRPTVPQRSKQNRWPFLGSG
jgi:hypothetical protein